MFAGQKVYLQSTNAQVADSLNQNWAELVKSPTEASFIVVDIVDPRTHCGGTIGVQAVEDSVALRLPLPTSSSAIASRAMETVVVAVDGGVPDKMCSLVAAMNGKLLRYGDRAETLSESVTHIVCSSVSSALYQLAMSRNLCVLSAEWLEACFNSNALLTSQRYLLPPLAGLHISVTGLAQVTRRKLQSIIVSQGGLYCPDLKKSSTHLIAEVASGIKYKCACAWGIPVVTIAWVFESVNQRRCLPTVDYALLDNAAEKDELFWLDSRKKVLAQKSKKRQLYLTALQKQVEQHNDNNNNNVELELFPDHEDLPLPLFKRAQSDPLAMVDDRSWRADGLTSQLLRVGSGGVDNATLGDVNGGVISHNNNNNNNNSNNACSDGYGVVFGSNSNVLVSSSGSADGYAMSLVSGDAGVIHKQASDLLASCDALLAKVLDAGDCFALLQTALNNKDRTLVKVCTEHVLGNKRK